jgi:peroxiredoxin
MIQLGDQLPHATLHEFNSDATSACPVGPISFEVSSAAALKTIAIFAVPGAFTPTCSEKHLPGYISHAAALKAAGVDEIWCLSVNDAFVMGAWGQLFHASPALRMIADGSAIFTRSLGLELDLTGLGLGLRSQRYSMIVVNGTVKTLNVDSSGKLEVSGAEILLQQVKDLVV